MYAAMAGAMVSAAVGGVVFFFIPLGVSGGRGVNGMTRRNALDFFTHCEWCVCVCVCARAHAHVWCGTMFRVHLIQVPGLLFVSTHLVSLTQDRV